MKRKHFIALMILSYFFVLSCCAISYAAQKNNIIGQWRDTAYKSAIIYIFVADKNDVIMYLVNNKQDVEKIDSLKKQNKKYFSQLHQDLGQYYIINGKNELEIHDKEGFIRKCQPYSGPNFPLPDPEPTKAINKRKIEFVPTVVGDFQVQVDIRADLPNGSLLGVNLSKHGLANNDLFTGTDSESIPINNGKASILIDAQKKPHPSLAAIVKGKYDVKVRFSPFWKQNKMIAASAGITEPIEVIKVVSLNGTGKGAEDFKKQMAKAKNRKWVMGNVYQGMKWDAKNWENRFGKPEAYSPASGNPSILRMFYFKEIDMTVQVNTLKKEIVTWIDGRSR